MPSLLVFRQPFVTGCKRIRLPARQGCRVRGWEGTQSLGLGRVSRWGLVHRRHHYVWCVGVKRHHLEPVRWVKSEHKVGFVPIHPYDVKGRPPINRKEEVFAVNNKNGLSLERVKFDPGHPIDVLKSPPREFRNAYLRPLARADAPRMEAHAMKEPLPGNKGVRAVNIPIRFDSKSQNFMMSKQVMHGGKSVTVSSTYLEPCRHSAGTGRQLCWWTR
jgi:hypothetical protein